LLLLRPARGLKAISVFTVLLAYDEDGIYLDS